MACVSTYITYCVYNHVSGYYDMGLLKIFCSNAYFGSLMKHWCIRKTHSHSDCNYGHVHPKCFHLVICTFLHNAPSGQLKPLQTILKKDGRKRIIKEGSVHVKFEGNGMLWCVTVTVYYFAQ